MKINKTITGWVFGALALLLATGVPALAADGDPDAKEDVRNASAVAKLKEREQVSLLYVKGMT